MQCQCQPSLFHASPSPFIALPFQCLTELSKAPAFHSVSLPQRHLSTLILCNAPRFFALAGLCRSWLCLGGSELRYAMPSHLIANHGFAFAVQVWSAPLPYPVVRFTSDAFRCLAVPQPCSSLLILCVPLQYLAAASLGISLPLRCRAYQRHCRSRLCLCNSVPCLSTLCLSVALLCASETEVSHCGSNCRLTPQRIRR